MKASPSIGSNAAWSALNSVSVSILQLILIAVLARNLAYSDMATMFIVIAAIGVLEMASDFGGRVWGVRRFSIDGAFGKQFRIAITFKSFASCLILVLAIPVGYVSGEWGVTGMTVLIALTQPNTDPLIWALRSMNRMDIEAAYVIASRAIITIFMVLAAVSGLQIEIILLAWLLINVCRIIFESFHGKLRATVDSVSVKIEWNELYEPIKEIIPIGFAFLLMALFSRMPILSLGIIGAPDEDISYFSSAFNLVSGAMIVSTSIAIASFPYFSQCINKNDWMAVSTQLNRNLLYIYTLVLPASVVVMLFASDIMQMFFGEDYVEGDEFLQLLMIGLFVSSINFNLKYLLNAIGLNWWDTISVIIGLIFLGAIFILYRAHGASIAALSWIIGESVMCAVKLSAIRKKKPEILISYVQISLGFVMIIGIYLGV